VSVKGVDIACGTVVSSVGVHLTLQTLLPHPAPSTMPALGLLQGKLKASALQRSRGHISLFVTLDGSAESLRLPRHNCWVFPDYDHDKTAERLYAMDPASLDDEALAALHEPWIYLGMAFPSAKDPAWAYERPDLEDVSTAIVIAEVPTEWWTAWHGTRVHARPKDYERLKTALETKLMDALLARWPHLATKVKHVSSGTPLSTQHYLHKAHGESYGLMPTPAFFEAQEDWLRPTLDGVHGLYLAGQDVNFDGFAGGTLAGMMAAASVDGIGVWFDILFRAIGVKNLLKDLIVGGPDLTEEYKHTWEADETKGLPKAAAKKGLPTAAGG